MFILFTLFGTAIRAYGAIILQTPPQLLTSAVNG